MFIADLLESYVAESAKQLVVLYPGRFQPFHLGHKDVFHTLQNHYGRDHVWIATSNKTEPPRSPFNFTEKSILMHASGIPTDRIIESSNPYKLPDRFDPANTIFIVAVGAPDKDRLRVDSTKKDGSDSYYKTFTKLEDCVSADKHGYVVIANERKKIIDIGGKQIDVSHGTTVRDAWNAIRNNPKERQSFILQMYGRDDPEIGRVLDKIQPTEQVNEDIPPPENARKTQIAGTLGTYKKASDIFKQHGVSGKALDFGAGLGKGTPELGDDAESYEPFPNKEFKPHYVDVTKIPDNSYKRIVNLNVLNVVPNVGEHRIRDAIVKNIGRVLAPGGVAIITTRGRDVLTIKGTPGEEPMSMISTIGTYQKGFTQKELRDYVESVLGDEFEIKSINLGPAGVMIKKLESLSEGIMDNPNFVTWFGNSKIVDKDGNPLKVYHGTFADIHAFKSRGVARNFGNAQRLLGHFFTPDPAYASQYASTGTYGKFGGNVVPVYLSIQNPKFEDISLMDEIETRWSDRRLRKYKNKLIQDGHDGIIFTNRSGIYEIVAFSNKQMKSAVGNKGTYAINKSKLIAETFTQPYKLRWEENERGDYDALATLGDGTSLSIMFNKEGEDEYHVEFWRNHSLNVTGEGDAYRVFATVLHAIHKFVQVQKPWRIVFAASKDVEPGQNVESRAKLYNSLVARYAKAWGYDEYNEDHGDQVTYELTRLKNPVAEDAAGVGVVKNSKDPRYVMATMGDQNDVTGDTLGKEMAAFHLTDYSRMPKTKQKKVNKNIGKGVKESFIKKYKAITEELNSIKMKLNKD